MPKNKPPTAQTKVWLETITQDPDRCHYFTVTKASDNSSTKGKFGTWDAPFFSMEEAEQFKSLMQIRYTDARFVIGKGEIPTSEAFKQSRNRFWTHWTRKHKQRIQLLSKRQSRADVESCMEVKDAS